MLEERPLAFHCGNAELLGILSQPGSVTRIGVLIVVGGPQYRVGSHRQFTLLARALADAGYACLRFDHRGMGDSDGVHPGFDQIDDDVQAAIDAFFSALPTLEQIVLWGLCDAASASLLYLQRKNDPRVAGVVLLNPWVRSEQTLARTRIRHYYAQRLLQREFWSKLFSGRLSLGSTLAGIWSTLSAGSGVEAKESDSFQQKMREAWCKYRGETLLLLSGEDFTAREFMIWWNAFRADMPGRDRVTLIELPDANHTFSSQAHRQSVEQATIAWLDTRLGRS